MNPYYPITIDGNTYDWAHGSYQITHPRLATSKATVAAAMARTDSGPWVRQFKITLVMDNKGVSGGAKTIRNNLRASYAKATAISITTPDQDTYNVYFDQNLQESFRFDVDTTGLGYEYIVQVGFIANA